MPISSKVPPFPQGNQDFHPHFFICSQLEQHRTAFRVNFDGNSGRNYWPETDNHGIVPATFGRVDCCWVFPIQHQCHMFRQSPSRDWYHVISNSSLPCRGRRFQKKVSILCIKFDSNVILTPTFSGECLVEVGHCQLVVESHWFTFLALFCRIGDGFV